MVICERFMRKEVVVNGKEKLDSRYDNKNKCFTKWNILCAKIVAIVLFTLLIGCVIHKTVYGNENEEISKTFHISRLITKRTKNFVKVENKTDNCEIKVCEEYGDTLCCLSCTETDFTITTLNQTIDEKTKECKYMLKVELIMCIFPDNTIKKNWLSSSTPIRQLQITKSDIEDIEDEAFNSNIFKSMVRITLQVSNIKYFKKNMFKGLENIYWLEIQDNKISAEFEEGVFEYIANTLGTLQINRSNLKNSSVISNITHTNLNSLVEIDIRFNRFSSLLPNAFKNARKLKLLHIQDNFFETIHENIVLSNIVSVATSGNLWKCDCDLYWLKDFKKSNFDDTVCISQSEELQKPFKSIFDMDCGNYSPTTPSSTTTEFIPEETSSTIFSTSTTISSTSTTISSSSSSTTTPEITTTEISTETSSLTTIPSSSSPTTCSKTVRNELDVIHTPEGKLKISFPERTEGSEYYFFHSENIERCNSAPTFGTIEGIFVPDTSYTICEIPSKSPEKINCLSGRTLPAPENQTWLIHRDKIPIILTAVFVNLFCIVFTAVAIYFYIKKHPFIRNGNKRVFVMKTPNQQHRPVYHPSNQSRFATLHLPNREETVFSRRGPYILGRESPITYIPVTDASYFTPISERYAYVRRTPPLNRSISDLSMKTMASYVTENQISSWRKRSKKERAPVSNLFEEPPPLPPPRRRYEEVLVHEDEIVQQRSRDYW